MTSTAPPSGSNSSAPGAAGQAGTTQSHTTPDTASTAAWNSWWEVNDRGCSSCSFSTPEQLSFEEAQRRMTQADIALPPDDWDYLQAFAILAHQAANGTRNLGRSDQVTVYNPGCGYISGCNDTTTYGVEHLTWVDYTAPAGYEKTAEFGQNLGQGIVAEGLLAATGVGAAKWLDKLSDAARTGKLTDDAITSTFRGDNRPPSQIFDEGFEAVGYDLDLMRHASGESTNSGYVSTSQSPAVAGGFPDGLPTNVYEVRAPGGINVNDALGSSSPYPWELEIAYEGSIPSSCIVGCALRNGQWVPNPSFGPR